ncbi:EthD family reductase [Croceicoccus ponticola]|uniref:EthD family reductase n=1 Tax=Croceicoccus ponticola TaxID=2217664 RepID=A0A437GW67_9SPHN|nr:EthD domain-containing protein [Croceicoccus ponticola]RVQ66344.1 EthD family reductase [Croceicoccus ponticola]
MFKAFVFLKRKDGMSVEEFRSYYETTHALLGKRMLPNLKKYVRHYLNPVGDDGVDDMPYDVITELWFDDRADFDVGMAHISDPDNARIIGEDEENLFDRSAIRFVTVEDAETELDKGYTSQI